MPEALKHDFLGTLRIEIGKSFPLESTPSGWRRIDVFGGGSFRGPRINGTMLAGTDSLLGRGDGSMQPDVRLTIETDDGSLIYVTYRGVRHGPPDVMEKIAKDVPVAPDQYYLRCVPFFETSAARYDWLNRIVSVGVGRREPGAAIYDIYEIM